MTTIIIEETDVEEPRAYTSEEVRKQLVNEIIDIVDYAYTELADDDTDICIGDFIATEILDILEGDNCSGMPQFDLVVRYPEELKKEDIADGLNYYEDGMVIKTDGLHDLYFEEMKALAES